MERFQMENIYKANGLNDYKVNDINDLLKCHGIDCNNLSGYKYLKEEDKNIFEKFIVNFYNANGMNSRMRMIPKGIYRVENVEHLVFDKEDKNFIVDSKTEVYELRNNGERILLKTYISDGFNESDVGVVEKEQYLRYEYDEGYTNQDNNDRCDWLHIIDEGKQWY